MTRAAWRGLRQRNNETVSIDFDFGSVADGCEPTRTTAYPLTTDIRAFAHRERPMPVIGKSDIRAKSHIIMESRGVEADRT